MHRHRSSRLGIGLDKDESYSVTADFFLSFSNPTSLMILDIVRKKEMTSEEVPRNLGIKPQTAVTKLNAMERQGILASRVRSQKTIYRVADLKILKAFDWILEFAGKRLKQTGSSEKELSGITRKGKKPSKTVPGAFDR